MKHRISFNFALIVLIMCAICTVAESATYTPLRAVSSSGQGLKMRSGDTYDTIATSALVVDGSAVVDNSDSINSNEDTITINTGLLSDHADSINSNEDTITINTGLLSDHADSINTAEDTIAINVGLLSDHADSINTAEDTIASNVSLLSDHADSINTAEDTISINVGLLSDHADSINTSEDTIAINVGLLSDHADSINTAEDTITTNTGLLSDHADSINTLSDTVINVSTIPILEAAADSFTSIYYAGSTVYQSVFTFTNYTLTIVDSGSDGGHGSALLATLPEGHIQILSGHQVMTTTTLATNIDTNAVFDFAAGSTEVDSDANDTLSGTEQDITTKEDGTLSAGTLTFDTLNSTLFALDGSSSAAEIWLNCAVEAASISDTDTISCTGTITVNYLYMGDD